MQGITERTLQPTAIYAVIGLQMANGGLHRCSPFEPALLLLAQALEFAPVNDLPVRVVGVYAAKAQLYPHVPLEQPSTPLLDEALVRYRQQYPDMRKAS